MSRAPQLVLAVAVLCGLAWAGRAIVATGQAARLQDDPQAALRWQPHQPEALLAQGRRQLAAGQPAAAAATARSLLAAEPLQGRAFSLLMEVAAQRGQSAKAEELASVAARRDPRGLAAHARLLQQALQARRFDAAIAQLDLVLRVDPVRGRTLLPAMARLAEDPGFAAALVDALATQPAWRAGMLRALLADGAPEASGRVLGALRQRGGLDDAAFARWLDRLLQQGRWAEAYARWAGNLALGGAALPAVYDGGFARPPTGIGFDWRLLRIPGVLLEFVPDAGAQGPVAHARFLGRAVAQVNLEQPLLLGPGRYRLTAKMRAEDLRSDRGLEWTVTCAGKAGVLGSSERVEGSFGWRSVALDFVVPAADDCPGQWLRLRNPAPRGSAQRVSGDLWFDDVAIAPLAR